MILETIFDQYVRLVLTLYYWPYLAITLVDTPTNKPER